MGIKIDAIFTDILSLALAAGYAERTNKLAIVKKLSAQFDALKFFLQILWEIKALDNNKYAQLSERLAVIGKMIGGWLHSLK
ncbi:MAG: four helix bundle protein [Candidatus Magasanikbacteria bacterium]|nr:four helix bundle protein [Candidatus Magasanikbacteria bacterium]